MKLIDKDALVAEIEKLQLCTMDEHMNYYSAEAQGEYNALSKLESFLDTLEVKEIGVDLGDPKGDKSEKHIIDTKTLEVKEVDLEEYYHKFLEKEWFGNGCVRTVSEMMAFTAKHFFELGIQVSNKALKGEEV